MTEYAIETSDLSKTFRGGVVAVNGLDMHVPAGVVYGLIGRNGAGKTTAIRLLMGLLRAGRGEARVLGRDMWTAGLPHRSRVAYVAQGQRLPGWMTLAELCEYVSNFYAKWDRPYARALGDRLGLAWDRQLGLMSGGEQRKAAVLVAFAGRPDVLLLDEPAAGLDPIARCTLVDEIIDVIGAVERCTVLFSTHIISDLERVAEYVGVIDRGRLVTESKLEDMQTRTKRVQVIFDAAAPPDGFAVPGAIRSRTEGSVVTAVVRIAAENQFDQLQQTLGVRVSVFPLSLEDMFIELFGPKSPQGFEEDIA